MPGDCSELHVGVGSQPGSATQTLPLLSKPTPQGIDDGKAVSRMVGGLAWAVGCEPVNNVQTSITLAPVESKVRTIRAMKPALELADRILSRRITIFFFPGFPSQHGQ